MLLGDDDVLIAKKFGDCTCRFPTMNWVVVMRGCDSTFWGRDTALPSPLLPCSR